MDAINDPRAYMVGKRLVDADKSPEPSIVCNPNIDLKSLLTVRRTDVPQIADRSRSLPYSCMT